MEEEEVKGLNDFRVLLLIRKTIFEEIVRTINEIKFLRKVEYIGGILLLFLMMISVVYLMTLVFL